ncbi:MAG: FAD-dependent oxidoreductase, partial [Fidelibacterota bacterium]
LEQHDDRETITAEAVLVAVGVTGNGENLGLEKVGVTMEQGFIPVDAYCRTTRTGIYAIGDVTGPPLLAHVASAQGHVAAEHAAGLSPHPVRSDRIPGCTYCRPQVASVGFTEAEARRQGLKVKVGRFDFRANGKATATGQTEGFIKLIFDETYGELVGAHILGENATELIAEMNLALTLEATWDEVGNTIHAHPTLSEAVMEAALDAQGKAIHH